MTQLPLDTEGPLGGDTDRHTGGHEGGAAARRTTALAGTLFLFAIVGTTVIDTFAPLPAPTLIGAERTNFERLDEDARWLDGSKARRVAVHKRLSSRVRRALGPMHTALLLRYFEESASEQVLVGDDGWLFLDRQIGLPPRGQQSPSIDRSAAFLAACERRITAGGTRFIAVPIPRKSAVLAEFIPSGIELYPGMESKLLERLEQHGVEALDLRPMFESLEPRDRYLQLDSHWAQGARMHAAELMTTRAGVQSAAPTTRLVESPWTSAPTDLLRFAGVPEDSWVRPWLLRRPEVMFEIRTKGAATGSPEGAGPEPPPEIQAVKDRMPPLALFGTSFSRRLADYLAHFSDTPVFDGSQAGGFFLDSLANLRQCYNFGKWPEVLWYEFPVFKAFRLGHDKDLVLSPSQGFSLSVLPIVPTSPLRAELAPPAGAQRLSIERGHLITSGNGIAMVRVTRRGAGPGEGLWRLRTANLAADVPWHAARQELLIPILATHDLGGEVELIAQSNGAPAMNVTATLVTDLDMGSAVPGQVRGAPAAGTHGDPGASGAPATQRATFRDVTIERRSAVVAKLDLGPWQGPIELRSRTTEGSVASWQAMGAGRVTVVLDLSRHTGQSLESFEVSVPEAVEGWRLLSVDWAHRPR